MQLVVHDCLRIESDSVEDGRGDVVGTNRLVGRACADGIGGAVDLSAADATAGHQRSLALRPVIAAGVLVDLRRPPEIATNLKGGRSKRVVRFYNRGVRLPKPIQGWTLTTLREKLVKIGAKVVSHAKYLVFQLAEVAVPRQLMAAIVERIARLRPTCASG
jgi:hypothetical protein